MCGTLREAARQPPRSSPQEDSLGFFPLNRVASPGCVCIVKIKTLDFDFRRPDPDCRCHLAGEGWDWLTVKDNLSHMCCHWGPGGT